MAYSWETQSTQKALESLDLDPDTEHGTEITIQYLQGYINYGNGEYDGQGSGTGGGTMWSGLGGGTDGGRSVLFPDYRQS